MYGGRYSADFVTINIPMASEFKLKHVNHSPHENNMQLKILRSLHNTELACLKIVLNTKNFTKNLSIANYQKLRLSLRFFYLSREAIGIQNKP